MVGSDVKATANKSHSCVRCMPPQFLQIVSSVGRRCSMNANNRWSKVGVENGKKGVAESKNARRMMRSIVTKPRVDMNTQSRVTNSMYLSISMAQAG